MFKNLLVIVASLFLLSACSSSYDGKHANSKAAHACMIDFQVNVGDRVFFDVNKADLTEATRAALKKQAEWLKVHKDFMIVAEGHCDERGTKEYNIALGERRANSVKKFLVAQGVDEKRISVISYGKERPAVVGHDEAAWKKNRRAVTALN